MCHNITRSDFPYTFLLTKISGKEVLVGKKTFLVMTNKELRAEVMDHRYKWKKLRLGLQSEFVKHKQDVDFTIPTYFVHESVGYGTHQFSIVESRQIPSGYHISPTFYQTELHHGFIILSSAQYITAPVIFDRRSILFFDGRDVSVSQFILPKPSVLQLILELVNDFKRSKETEKYVQNLIISIDENFYSKLYERRRMLI